MYFKVGNKIEVHEPAPYMQKWVKDNLIVSNPDFEKKLRMGLWLGDTPEYISLYERNGGCFVLPFGCISDLMEMCPGMPFKSSIKPVQRFSVRSNINLYPYQEKAVEKALEAKNGILVMPCGSGKTQAALEIISRLRLKTLWLTHTQDLLNQSLNRAKSVLECDKQTYGTITGGKVSIGTGITFATVQTMAKLDLTQYKDAFSCVVVDECHKAVGSPTKVMQFYKVLSNLSCRYKFGLTATPKRADGMQKAMFALLGNVIFEVQKSEVINTTCPVKVEFVDTGYTPDLNVVLSGDGTLNYASLVDDMTHNKDRFEAVMQFLASVPANQQIMVLANRVEYLQGLCKEYKERQIGDAICLSAIGNSKSAKQARNQALNALNTGELDCIFATYQLAKEGLDVPNLRYVVFATPEKDETTVMQAAGRVGRKAEGKEVGTVVDFCDSFGMLTGWKKKRMKIYRKAGYEL